MYLHNLIHLCEREVFMLYMFVLPYRFMWIQCSIYYLNFNWNEYFLVYMMHVYESNAMILFKFKFKLFNDRLNSSIFCAKKRSFSRCVTFYNNVLIDKSYALF